MLNWLFSDPLPAGAEAPDFTLPDGDGREWKLSALRGQNVLLVFYPGDATPHCTKQLCEIRDQTEIWIRNNVQVLGVNPRSAKSHRSFAAKFRFPFPLLVDTGQRVAGLYNASGLFIRRTVYLIDTAGRVAFAERGMPVSAEILNRARL